MLGPDGETVEERLIWPVNELKDDTIIFEDATPPVVPAVPRTGGQAELVTRLKSGVDRGVLTIFTGPVIV
jgi:hypothetical protein